ncbi:SRPBCC family protein [Nonomuraea indica]|uniref:SRPBCC family protein n=1 Tax=Nonomuraea indica TaxID=1581193 RepID=A0ABW8AEE0_9ACTN|nr:SRPBCC family protein [Nonomuraea indica]
MAEYEATRGMPADSDITFGVASDVDMVNRWLPHGLLVRDSGPGTVEATGDLVPGDGAHEGLFRVSREQLRVEWGGRDHPEYAGWLQVTDSGTGTSEVVVHLSLLGEPDERTSPERRAEVQGLLEEALGRLADEVTRRVTDAG